MVAQPSKAGTTTPAIDSVAERQLMSRHSTTKSFMNRSATPWMLVSFFGGRNWGCLKWFTPASGIASAIRVSAIFAVVKSN